MAEDSQHGPKRVHHTWTAEEDEVLVECLLDVGDNWKGDNGFRPGIHTHLEKMMQERIPNCQVKGNPHIVSRIKILKRNYNAISEMKNASGFGWNEQDKMLIVEKEIYNNWVKSHPNARGLFNKPFPHFDQLGVIFGKDVATGQDAEVAVDTLNAMEPDAPIVNDIADDFYQAMGDYPEPPIVDGNPDIQVEEVTDQTRVSTSFVKNRNKRARAEDTVILAISDAMKDLTESYREGNDHMSKLVQLQTDSAGKRMRILTELKKMVALSGRERAQVVRMMAKDRDLTAVFMEGDDEDKYDIVSSLLQNPE